MIFFLLFIIIHNIIMNSFTSCNDDILKIAHRGYSEMYGDNNIISFQKAIENKFDMIEMDIQLSKDNKIIIYHDIHIDNRYVKNIHSKELSAKYNIITLKDFFNQVNYKNIKINFDLKGENPELLIETLISILFEYHVDTSLLYISSFNKKFIHYLIIFKRHCYMNYKIGFITSNTYLDFELDILLQGTNFIVIDYTMLTHNVVEYCHHKGIDVFTYTNKNIYTYDLIKQFNIDGIISNCKLPDINQI